MQDSMDLPSSEGQHQNHNQFAFNSVISPKGRRLTKGINLNTASHQSLAYSNSTHNKNQITERSPPLFNIQNISNQNINTLNFRVFDKKESTFGSNRRLAIQFDKIKEQSYLSNFDEDKNLNQPSLKQKIDFPCFLSNQNSPNKIFQTHNDSLNNDNQNEQQCRQVQNVSIKNKKYTKITPSTKGQIKQSILKKIKEKVSKTQKSKAQNLTNKSKTKFKQSIENLTNTSVTRNGMRQNPSSDSRSKSPILIKNDQIQQLRQKVKQLEYSLQVQSITTEQLRTKVTVLNQLLEQKFLEKNGINFKLFKNSSPAQGKVSNNVKKTLKDNSNIDLYVEMKIIEKSKQQLQIQYERLQTQLFQKEKQLTRYISKCEELSKKYSSFQKSRQQSKTQTSFIEGNTGTLNNRFRGNEELDLQRMPDKIKDFEQEKQGLISQIKSQQNSLQLKNNQILELENRHKQSESRIKQFQEYIRIFEEKEKRFTEIQRPKFISQIKELSEKLDSQKEQIQKLQMQNNLLSLRNCQHSLSQFDFNQSPKAKSQNKISLINQSRNNSDPKMQNQIQASNLKENTDKVQKHMSQNPVPDPLSLIMIQEEELKILKRQRDYFKELSESLKRLQNENYSLKLRNQDLQNQLHSLHQLIEVEDQVTF